MTEPLKESQKVQALEGLRGFLAAWVILGHLSQTFDWHFPLLNRNVLAVDVFILLSGFVIARLIDLRREPYGPYITRRALRLFPLYLVVLALSVPMLGIELTASSGLPFGADANSKRVWLAGEALAHLPAHLAVHLPLMQGLVPTKVMPGAPFTLIGQAWSMSLEWQFYLVAPLVMWSLGNRRRWPLLLLATSVLLLPQPYFDDAYLGAKILHFLVGICSYLALSRPGERRMWLLSVGVLMAGAVIKDGITEVVPLAIWAIVLLSTFAAAGGLLHLPARILGAPLAIHFGEMAYSLYLTHMIVFYLSLYALRMMHLGTLALQAGVAALTLAGTYLLARATYLWVETPGIALGARLTRARA
jgi:peptidoglycan/LPS O-acetylase OafA/YrhL